MTSTVCLNCPAVKDCVITCNDFTVGGNVVYMLCCILQTTIPSLLQGYGFVSDVEYYTVKC